MNIQLSKLTAAEQRAIDRYYDRMYVAVLDPPEFKATYSIGTLPAYPEEFIGYGLSEIEAVNSLLEAVKHPETGLDAILDSLMLSSSPGDIYTLDGGKKNNENG